MEEVIENLAHERSTKQNANTSTAHRDIFHTLPMQICDIKKSVKYLKHFQFQHHITGLTYEFKGCFIIGRIVNKKLTKSGSLSLTVDDGTEVIDCIIYHKDLKYTKKKKQRIDQLYQKLAEETVEACKKDSLYDQLETGIEKVQQARILLYEKLIQQFEDHGTNEEDYENSNYVLLGGNVSEFMDEKFVFVHTIRKIDIEHLSGHMNSMMKLSNIVYGTKTFNLENKSPFDCLITLDEEMENVIETEERATQDNVTAPD